MMETFKTDKTENNLTKTRMEKMLAKVSGFIFDRKIFLVLIILGILVPLFLNLLALNKQPKVAEAKSFDEIVLVETEEKIQRTDIDLLALDSEKPKEVVQPSETLEEIVFPEFENDFIDLLKKDVVQVSKDYNLFPSVMMAQAIIESGWGESLLSVQANNFFGVKAIEGQNFVTMSTREETPEGESYYIEANFAKYDNLYDSIEQNALVLYNNYDLYYGSFRNHASHYTESTQWLTKRYATDLEYHTVLNNMIQTYGLDRLDNL